MFEAIGILFLILLIATLIGMVGWIIVAWDEARLRLDEQRRWKIYQARRKARGLNKKEDGRQWDHQIYYTNGQEEGFEHYEGH